MKAILILTSVLFIASSCTNPDQDYPLHIRYNQKMGVVELDGKLIASETDLKFYNPTLISLQAIPNSNERINFCYWMFSDSEVLGHESLYYFDSHLDYLVDPYLDQLQAVFSYEINTILYIINIMGEKKVLFSSNHFGNNDLIIMNCDGTEKKNLTVGKYKYINKVQFDARTGIVIFDSNKIIYKIDLSTNKITELFNMNIIFKNESMVDWIYDDINKMLYTTSSSPSDIEYYDLVSINILTNSITRNRNIQKGACNNMRIDKDGNLYFLLWYSKGIWFLDNTSRKMIMIISDTEGVLDFEISPDSSELFYRQKNTAKGIIINLKSKIKIKELNRIGQCLDWSSITTLVVGNFDNIEIVDLSNNTKISTEYFSKNCKYDSINNLLYMTPSNRSINLEPSDILKVSIPGNIVTNITVNW